MNQKALVSDLARLEEMTTDTNLLIHIARIRKRAENGFYHLQAGTIRNPTWEIECRGAGLRSRLIYTCDEHVPDEAILSPQDEIRRLVEK